ncbi:proteinase-activated receptor 2-like [Petromyzon marinus]|uniref:Proteinase-activated receptor 2-like n=1 Tax=Petromyzon marinus TaxID=7757 RepID=A0AAJ7X3E6_PETMA|nr:proteinase-activated receptor 2-like [Petromyzon marinus]
MANVTTLSEETRQMLTGSLTTVVLPCIYLLVLAVGLPAHATALWVFLFKTRTRTASNVYMANLAAVNLLYVLFLPLQIAYHFRGNDWPFGRPLCHVFTQLLYTNTHCSTFFLTCVSVDRYLAIVRPLHARHMHGVRRAALVTAGIWVLTLVMLSPVQSINLLHHVQELNITTCYDVFPKEEGVVTFFLVYCVVFVAVNFFVPVCITVFCYASIIRALTKAKLGSCSDGRNNEDIRKGIQLSVVVLVTFVLCFAPNNCVLLAHALLHWTKKNSDLYGIYKLMLAFSSLNTCFDPIVFYFVSSEFQARVLSALACWWRPSMSSRPELLRGSSGTGRDDSELLQDAPGKGDQTGTSTTVSSPI